MITNKCQEPLRYRVEKFLSYEWDYNKAFSLTQEGILNSMQQNLRDEVNIDMCASLLKRIRLFQEVSNELIDKLATVAEMYMVPVQEIIVYTGSVHFSLYIIQDGYAKVRNFHYSNISST
ncbi:hypothetical protein L9F63_009873 [Diploptera punctata]|uniref:Cyclic nucleotide-binding domain-containing protein n=1 Tax=Diploptera punctata TaxID=6984 RepID=A0AAD8ERB3_DIPPU|nr:hypothetical protein L9F63_009873 [Diploptera punctata]